MIIAKADTTTVAFAGPCHMGPKNQAQLVSSLAEFEQTFGDGQPLTFRSEKPSINYLWHSVHAFFAQGGRRLYIARVSHTIEASRPSAVDYARGFKALESIDDIFTVAAPGCTAGYASHHAAALAIMNTLITHVTHMRYRFAILDCGDQQSITDVRAMRSGLDSSFAALYYPWVLVMDSVSGMEISLPPSGFLAGIYVRNDLTKSVSHSPANESVTLATGFEQTIDEAQQTVLNFEGINCLRTLPDHGNMVWGARTISADSDWKYVNVRRYLACLEKSIDRGTKWAEHEHNDETLWANIHQAIEEFLSNEWKTGSLLGSKPEESFYVKCDRTTMTQNDIDKGHLVCQVGVAPLSPSEFINIRIGQKTKGHKG
jgi:phage tail sheath protein FI